MRISYPPELPISARHHELIEAIRDNQVVIVAGETGSGKTTQLPKICLELGRGAGGRGGGRIGHTQPRRLAARTIAARIAEELGDAVGETVGWKVRFTDEVSEQTRVKLMTDGILLAELGHDRMLRQYDTLIIDEAHERSLNIDFILGYLKRLLPRRPDLKLIITSATIDVERFAAHFGTPGRPAPIVEVSGRTYPVELRYRPITDPDQPEKAELDQPEAIVEACRELASAGPGDILVFLPGERDIRDATETLAGAVTEDGERGVLRHTEILPLYARLSAAEQQRVWSRHGRGIVRRIVLATNVAETSLTVPGIKYVVDTGTARISRYSHRTKVQRLPIEKVSQASANQRAGRCGRTSDGICIRLYAEDDFDARPEFTDPEILRTNLASVILRMIALGLGESAASDAHAADALLAFPFVDPPDRRAVTDGVNLLHELGAVTSASGSQPWKITEIGRSLDRIPVDPRFARMLVEADRNGCVADVLVIVAGMSIQDPRERPAEHQQAADAAHARFADPRSDFLSLRNLWHYLVEQRGERSGSQFRRMCRAEYLHFLRIREWQDLHGQLRRVLRDMDVNTRESEQPGDEKALHQSLLAGLLSHIGLQTEPPAAGHEQRNRNRRGASARARNAYTGARGASFAIFPGSALYRRPPRWVMAAELVETSRLWARTVARIEPEWIEPLAAHLVRSSFSEPHWSAKRGAVMAHERVTLYGVPIVVDRLTNYTSVDPALCRELFIRHALVAGEWRTQHQFFDHNQRLLEQIDEWEQRTRRRDLGVDEQTLFDFYDKRIPERVASVRHFDRWWKTARRDDPTLLDMSLDQLTRDRAPVSEGDYPSVWTTSTPGAEQPATLAVNYEFSPGASTDGVSVDLPLAMLAQLDGAAEDSFSWQVPGHREELVTALIRSLRKDLRRNFVPVPDTVRVALAEMDPDRGGLIEELTRVLRERYGVTVPRDAWRTDRIPEHLRLTFRVLGEDGSVVGTGKDLAELRARLARRTRAALSTALSTGRASDTARRASLERSGLTSWPTDTAELPRELRQDRDGYQLVGYPALLDDGDTVSIRVFGTPAEQAAAMWRGTRRLLLLSVPSPVRQVRRTLGPRENLALARAPHGSLDALLADCLDAASDVVLAGAGGPAWTGAGFTARTEAMRTGLTGALVDVVAAVVPVLSAADEVAGRLSQVQAPGVESSLADVRTQLSALVYPGFVAATGAARLPDLARYLRAAARRLETLPRDPARDRDWMARVHDVRAAYDELRAEWPPDRPLPPAASEIRWMIEELRVSFFAQELKTRYPVSEKRIYRAIDDLLR